MTLRHRRCRRVGWPCVALALCALPAGHTQAAQGAPPGSARGAAVLASSIGRSYAVDRLAKLSDQLRFSEVVVDWAWITAHWGKTDFAEVNRLLDALTSRGIQVAAMYRPRFFEGEDVRVPFQTDEAGQAFARGREICLSSAEARQWGIHWGEEILRRCPSVTEVIVYNPRMMCRCPVCRAALQANPDHYLEVQHRFLAEAGAAFRRVRPEATLGAVYTPDERFWRRMADVVDAAYPYLPVQKDTDYADAIRRYQALEPILGKRLRAGLAKVDWADQTDVTTEGMARFIRMAEDARVPYVLWLFGTVFTDGRLDVRTLAGAFGVDAEHLVAAVGALSQPTSAAPGPAGDDAELAARVGAYGAGDIGTLVEIMLSGKGFLAPITAANRLGNLGDPEAIPHLMRALKADNPAVRRCSALALAKLGATEACAELERIAREDRFVWRDPQTGRERYLVRDDAARALAQLRALRPAVGLEDASQLPPTPLRRALARLPWPFPGGMAEQNIWNNYAMPTDSYIHDGLDFLHPAGTPVAAVAPGYVAAIFIDPSEWKTHGFFVIAPEKDADEGWCYAHLDPGSYTFREGDRIEQGQTVGKLVKFSVRGTPGSDHLHLNYVRFRKLGNGGVSITPLFDPLLCFAMEDKQPPLVLTPFHFVRAGTLEDFPADAQGRALVKGRADIIAGIADSAYAGHQCNWGVPVVTLSIKGPTQRPLQRLVLDHRGEMGDPRRTEPLYLNSRERKRYAAGLPFRPYYHFLRVTKSDGNGLIDPPDARQAWDTTARDERGDPLYRDGRYLVTVYAWDLAGNRAKGETEVWVKNQP